MSGFTLIPWDPREYFQGLSPPDSKEWLDIRLNAVLRLLAQGFSEEDVLAFEMDVIGRYLCNVVLSWSLSDWYKICEKRMIDAGRPPRTSFSAHLPYAQDPQSPHQCKSCAIIAEQRALGNGT